MTVPFVHLRLHSEYSLVDGLVKLKSLVSTTAERRMPALALTDEANLFGLVKFYKAAQSAGLKPIEASNSRAVVRSFPNLFGSVRAYMHNLNTHSEYARFRDRRSLLSGRKRNDLGTQLSVFLDGYAEIGVEYVEKIQTIIRSNDLGQFEAARLQ